MKRRLSHIFAPVLAVLVATSVAACDTAGTEAESDFAYFTGTWTVTSVTIDGADLGDPGDLTFRFFEEDGQRRFSISGEGPGGQSVNIEGGIAFGIGNEFGLRSEDFLGESDFVEVRYDIENSTHVDLHPAENGDALVRELINRNLADVTITLVRTP